MFYVISNDELYHHGIKGQKWGIRRYQNEDGSLTPIGKKRYSDVLSDKISEMKNNEKDYRKKLTAITKRKGINDSDRRLFNYRNKSLAARYAETGTKVIAGKLIGDLISGNLDQYSRMNKSEIIKELTKVAVKTTANVALNDALAKSAAKGYTDEGKRANSKKDNRLLTKQDMTLMGINTALLAAPYVKFMCKIKLNQALRDRAINEARFKRWGPNILTDKVVDYSNFVRLVPDDWKIVE